MYVCVRACVFDFRHFFPSRLDFCFNISKTASTSEKRKLAFWLFRVPKVFEALPQRALSFSRFRSLTVQRYSIKKRKTPYVGGTRRGYGLI